MPASDERVAGAAAAGAWDGAAAAIVPVGLTAGAGCFGHWFRHSDAGTRYQSALLAVGFFDSHVVRGVS